MIQINGSGFIAQGSGVRVLDLEFGVWGLKLWDQGLGFRFRV
jgi:hypothetical protein